MNHDLEPRTGAVNGLDVRWSNNAIPPGVKPLTHPHCDLLLVSTDRYVAEATITAQRLIDLELARHFDSHILLGTLPLKIGSFKTLHRLQAGTWSSELREGLQQLSKPYVLMWLDDLVPLKLSSVEQIVERVDALIALEGNYLRLNPTPPANGVRRTPGLREVLPTELYRTSTIISVWHRETLIALLDDAESAWQFEFAGSTRSAAFGGFYACESASVKFVNLVIKGLVDPRAERLLVAAGVDASSVDKPRMLPAQVRQMQVREFRSGVLKLLPWQLRSKVRNMFSTNPAALR